MNKEMFRYKLQDLNPVELAMAYLVMGKLGLTGYQDECLYEGENNCGEEDFQITLDATREFSE